MIPLFFSTPDQFREWLVDNHDKATELVVGYYKVASGKPSLTWSQSVDEALCFGWIDGVRRTIDADSYCIRFTPRKPKSIWSAVNIQKIENLTQQGLMHPAGLMAYGKRQESKSKIYAYEQEQVSLSDGFEQLFRANEQAWINFQKFSASYQKMAINWVMSAKQNITALKRLDELINDSILGQKVKLFRREIKKS